MYLGKFEELKPSVSSINIISINGQERTPFDVAWDLYSGDRVELLVRSVYIKSWDSWRDNILFLFQAEKRDKWLFLPGEDVGKYF